MANPSQLYGRPWSEREYIIVLYSYFKNRDKPRHHLCDYVVDLAKLLGRTPGAIVMRMENYASVDPDDNAKGLINISALGQQVFKFWHDKPDSLRDCAELLIRDSQHAGLPDLFDPDPVKVPRAFGKYELLDLLGSGGFGSVYSCINSEDQKAYAMKIISADKVSDSEMLSRFRREIRALKSLEHPNVVKIHEDNLDEERNFPAFVMDLGKCTLGQYLEEKLVHVTDRHVRPRLPEAEAIEIMEAAIDAVRSLHTNSPKVLHRDIKPDNLLRMGNNRWALADFSLAKFAAGAVVTTTFATLSHKGWGTDGYSAPEQWQDFKRTDERADIYSLGVLVWELFSPSWPPLDRDSLQLPPLLQKLVLKATERDRSRRHISIEDFGKEFKQAVAT
jgi:serine/threonine protein kinase